MALPVKWKILLIDDEQDIRDIVGITLEDAGYSVIYAPDGHTGLMLATRENPQIVVTDIKMPGLTGLEVLEKVKKLKPETEVIVTTGYGDIKKAVKALQHDASDFLSKPIDDDALHMALKRAKQRYLDRKQLADYTILLENENLKTSAELIRNVEFQSSLIENSMDGILGCEGKGLVITYNRSMEKLLGYPKARVLKSKKIQDFFNPGAMEKLKQDLHAEAFGGPDKLAFYETAMVSSQNREIPVQVSGFMLHREDMDDAMVLFVSDLRQVRILEQEKADQAKLLHQEKMISLGRLAASMVHEINNPLSGILNYIRLMLKKVDQNNDTGQAGGMYGKFRSYLDIVESETQRCSDLVSGLLKFSRKTTLAKKDIDINELVDHSLLLCSHKLELSNIVLRKQTAPSVPPVFGDFNQLEQCVINLIFNAVDAIESGGQEFKAPEKGRTLDVRTGFIEEEDLVFISVKDNGKGIPKSELNFIFEPFFTTKKEGYGVGLGLSTAFGIVENHKGTIVVESIQDLGSEFTVKLPPSHSGEPGE